MNKLFASTILVAISLFAKAQGPDLPPPAPPEASPFILAGYEALDYVAGDLNGDGKRDGILILKQLGEDTATDMDNSPVRPLLILIRQADGKLKQVARNDEAVMCRQCGGAMGDPYASTRIANNGFTLSFYGGSSWRWAYDFQFAWKPLKKNWFQVKETQVDFNAGDPKTTTKKLVIEETELGSVSIEEFNNVNTQYGDGEWKVKVAKTFFYDTPKLGSKPRKDFAIKDKILVNVRELKNFVQVTYMKDSYNTIMGFVLKKDLEKRP